MTRLTLAALSAKFNDMTRTVVDAVATLGTHNARIEALEARIAELEATPSQPAQKPAVGRSDASQRYPHVDYRGRSYRTEVIGGRTIKAYQS